MDTPQTQPAPQNNNNNPHQKNMGMAILCYLGILVIVPLLTDVKNDSFVKFHIKQGLVLLIAEVIASVVHIIPVFGWFLGPLLWLGCVILSILGIVNAANGHMKELPVVGHFASNFNF